MDFASTCLSLLTTALSAVAPAAAQLNTAGLIFRSSAHADSKVFTLTAPSSGAARLFLRLSPPSLDAFAAQGVACGRQLDPIVCDVNNLITTLAGAIGLVRETIWPAARPCQPIVVLAGEGMPVDTKGTQIPRRYAVSDGRAGIGIWSSPPRFAHQPQSKEDRRQPDPAMVCQLRQGALHGEVSSSSSPRCVTRTGPLRVCELDQRRARIAQGRLDMWITRPFARPIFTAATHNCRQHQPGIKSEMKSCRLAAWRGAVPLRSGGASLCIEPQLEIIARTTANRP